MILHPAIIALLLGSILISSMLLYSSWFGGVILRRWDLKSGSELQLVLERKTYLISTIMSYAFAFQIMSLFLFTRTADSLCSLFTGAMCAAGTLFVNEYGYPTLILKIVSFLLAGLWLILNHADNRAYDYPLIRKKYALLLIVTPVILAETVVQWAYFLGLHPDIITSCCGSIFSKDTPGLASGVSALPVLPIKAAFYPGIAATLLSGVYFYLRGKGGCFFSVLSGASFVISVAALISFISLYFYELPTHHCPFCILQREYGYVGYPLYLSLLSGAVSGMGVGILMPFRKIVSLKNFLPSFQKRLALTSLLSYLLFAAIVIYRMAFSGFILG